jgi:hypothetical protein
MAVTKAPHRRPQGANLDRRSPMAASPLRGQLALLAGWILDPVKRYLEWLLRFGVSPSARTILELRRQENLIETVSSRETSGS